MISFKHIRFLIEAYRDRLKQKGVSQGIIDYVETLSSAEKGAAIAKLMANPKLEMDDLKGEDFLLRDTEDHLDVLFADPTVTVDVVEYETPPGRYYKIIAKWVTDGHLRLATDTEAVQKVLAYYHENKDRFETKYISKYKTFQDLEQEYLDVSGTRVESNRQAIRDIKMEGSVKLLDSHEWLVYAITTEDAACYYGKGTQWCTAATEGHNYASSYLTDGPLYIFIDKHSGEKFQSNHNFTEIQDEENREVTDDSSIIDAAVYAYNENPNVNEASDLLHALEWIVTNNNYRDPEDSEIETYLQSMEGNNLRSNTQAEYAYDALRFTDKVDWSDDQIERLERIILTSPHTAMRYAAATEKRIPGLEEIVLTDSDSIVAYAQNVIKGRWPEGEEALLEIGDPRYVFTYAENVIKDRWIEGEDILATDSKYSYYYATDILEGRFEKGEPVISQSAQNSYRYAVNVLKKARFPAGEESIATSPVYAYDYASQVIKGPFPEGEEAIGKDLFGAYRYVEQFIKGPFPEAEETFAQDSETAYKYARFMLKGRFEQGEKAIARNKDFSSLYAEYVLKGRFPEGEHHFANKASSAYFYATNVLKGPFPEGEEMIATSTAISYHYAMEVLKARFPAGEEKISSGSRDYNSETNDKFRTEYNKAFGTNL